MNEKEEMMPDFIKNLWGRIPGLCKIGFFTALVTGFIVHFFMLTNKITNVDDIGSVPGVGGGAILGRWLQEPLHEIFSQWAAPSLNGTMSILFISIATCFIVSALNVKTVTGAVLIPVVIMTFPSIASNMYYMFDSPMYGVAILLCSLNIYLTVKYKFGWIIGSVLQFLSMGLYQAYFAFTASVYILFLILVLLDGKDTVVVFKKGIICLINLVLTMAGYLVSLKFVELSDYKGLNSIGSMAPIELIHAIARAYHRVIQYFITDPESFMAGAPTMFNRALCICMVILLIYLIISKKIYSEPLRLLLIIVLLAIMPLSLGLVYVMASTVSHASTVMIFSYVVFYFSLITGMERIEISGGVKKAGISYILAGAIFILLILEAYSEARIINTTYYRSYIAQHRVMQYYNRILTKLYDTEGYDYDDPVLLCGGFYPDPVPVANHNMNGAEMEDFEGATLEDHIFIPDNRERALQIWFGINTGDYSTKRSEIMATSEFEEMPIYPADGCIKQIDGIWIIKIGPDDSK